MSHQRHDNRPRSYSTLIGGRIIWIDPGDPRPAAPAPKLRSRLETDAEVRARICEGGRKPYGIAAATGKVLDEYLKIFALEPRRFVDEVA